MELAKYIEHTLLRPDITEKELIQLLEEAKQYKFKGVCVNPINVKKAKKYLYDEDIKIVTVVSFPLGAATTRVKVYEAQKAIEEGADEIDMVVTIQAVKSKEWDYVKNDIAEVKKACGKNILKVILETDLLTEDEILKCCELAVEAKADFVKTSTGFAKNGVGAKVKDIELISKIVKPSGVRIKASGGIKNAEKAEMLIIAGANRLGTSSGVDIVCGK